jgi:hypothetical protein
LRISIALATAALLCSISLLGSGASQAAGRDNSIGAKCLGYKTSHVSITVCDYGLRQPFLLRGYSRGGSSTLSYTVQCGNAAFWPTRRAAIDHRVWFRRSVTVSGRFKIYGVKDTPRAARHCAVAKGKTAFLTIKLKMGKRVTRTNLVVRLDSTLPWGN